MSRSRPTVQTNHRAAFNAMWAQLWLYLVNIVFNVYLQWRIHMTSKLFLYQNTRHYPNRPRVLLRGFYWRLSNSDRVHYRHPSAWREDQTKATQECRLMFTRGAVPDSPQGIYVSYQSQTRHLFFDILSYKSIRCESSCPRRKKTKIKGYQIN